MILLVEDEAVSRMVFARTLRAEGYEIFEAVDGAEAIALLDQHHPEIELVIADMVLPKVNGLTLVREIKTRWPSIPVIMVSGYVGGNMLARQVDVLEKPFRPAALSALVHRIIPQPHH